MESTKFIIYEDKKYWISGSGRYFYYCPYQNGVRQKRVALHRKVWEDFNSSKIPDGYDVHHIDGNTFNNNPNNLAIIESSEHNREHAKEYWKNNHEKATDNLNKAREMASKWHGSEDGRKWHSENSKKIWSTLQRKTVCCVGCGKEYFAYRKGGYCSNSCCQKSYYRDKKYHENRKCITCGHDFSVRKSEHTRNCSRKCAAKSRRSKGLHS